MKLGKLLGQGRTAEIYEISDTKAVKLFRPFFPEASIQHEYWIVSRLVDKGLPTPNVDEIINIGDRQGIIYEKVSGPTMMQVISANPLCLKREANRLAELHRSIQVKIDFNFPSQKLRIAENISKTNLLNDELKSALLKKLDLLPDENILCHGDFHPDNIIISKEKVWVIDWTNATAGNSFSDVARTTMLLKYAIQPEHQPWFKRALINKIRLKFYNEYLLHYLQLIGGDIHNVEKWEPLMAASRLIEWIPQKEKNFLIEIVRNACYDPLSI